MTGESLGGATARTPVRAYGPYRLLLGAPPPACCCRADEQLRASLELFHGFQWGVASTLDGLGDVAWAQGDYASAEPYYTAELAIRRTMTTRRGRPWR